MRVVPPLTPDLPTTMPAEAASRAEQAAQAGKAFEELLLHELLKSMRQTLPREDGDFGGETFEGMFDQAIAEQTAGTLGIAKMLERQLGGTGSMPVVPRGEPLRLATQAAWDGGKPAAAAPVRDFATPVRGPKTATGIVGMQLPVGALPVDGARSSDYGHRIHPISGEHKFHGGIDIAAPEGTEIRAVQSGVVTHAGWKPGYGNVVEVLHPDGVTSRYAHASRIHVREGQRVDAGEGIADVGQTGQATGPHLHFEVRRHGHTIDPDRYLRRLRGESADAADSDTPPET